MQVNNEQAQIGLSTSWDCHIISADSTLRPYTTLIRLTLIDAIRNHQITLRLRFFTLAHYTDTLAHSGRSSLTS